MVGGPFQDTTLALTDHVVEQRSILATVFKKS